MNYKKLDKDLVWHPFTQSRIWEREEEGLIIERGEGSYLFDVEGNKYLDGVSSLWANVHGHSHPKLVQAIKDQADKLCHSTLLGLSHKPIIELSEKLKKFLPNNLERLFYSDSGTTAVEASLRMSLEYWQKKKNPNEKKTKLASLYGAYHGDTMGAVSVGYLDVFHKHLKDALIPSKTIRPPHYFSHIEGFSKEEAHHAAINEMSYFFKKESHNLAAFIIEPLVQGAAGMWIHQKAYLQELRRLCTENEVLLIIDEVATGFGKTGAIFASELAEVKPDLMIMAKGLSAGYLPISCVAATEEIYLAFSGEPEELKTFFYGQTFAGNPLAASVASVNLDLFSESGFMEGVNEKIDYFASQVSQHLLPLQNVYEVRQKGIMTAIELSQKKEELVPYPANDLIGPKIVWKAREKGIIIRPLGNSMILMPPLSMKKNEISELVNLVGESVSEVCEA